MYSSRELVVTGMGCDRNGLCSGMGCCLNVVATMEGGWPVAVFNYQNKGAPYMLFPPPKGDIYPGASERWMVAPMEKLPKS